MTAAAVLLLSILVAVIGTHLSKALQETVNFDSFAVGDCVEVDYIAPSTSRVTIFLLEENDDILLYADYRVKYRNQINTLALKSRVGGRWSKAKYLKDIESIPGTHLRFQLCAKAENAVSILYNGKLLTTYSYDDTNISNLRHVTVDTRGSGAQVQEICINYA